MRNLFISAALLLAACGPSEDSFADDFLANACDAACDDSEFYCNPGDSTTDGTSSVECDFDKKAAKDCLNGEFTCDGEEGATYTVAPAACDYTKIYTNCTGGTAE